MNDSPSAIPLRSRGFRDIRDGHYSGTWPSEPDTYGCRLEEDARSGIVPDQPVVIVLPGEMNLRSLWRSAMIPIRNEGIAACIGETRLRRQQ